MMAILEGHSGNHSVESGNHTARIHLKRAAEQIPVDSSWRCNHGTSDKAEYNTEQDKDCQYWWYDESG